MSLARRWRGSVGWALAAVLITTAGCGPAVAIGDRAGRFKKTPRQFTLPEVPTLVLVENFDQPSLNEVDAQRLAQRISDQLAAEQVAPIVPIQKVRELREKDRAALRQMTIPQVGKAVGAQQVIYVNLTEFSVETDASGTLHRASGAASVRVVDVATGGTLWPHDFVSGRPVDVTGKWVRGDTLRDSAQIREPVYESLTTQIATLFYDYLPPF